MSRTNLSSVVSRQLPEHIREDYPTFVAFVEAYYEFLQTQGVDFSTFRDIDKTLEEFVSHFKKELAYNLPNITQDERFLLQNVKDQYLAKGSEGSYKLLFRLLFGKEVELVYPGRSMLRASDGRWNQDLSVFAKVDFGNPEDVIGKLVDIQTPTRTIRVLIDRSQDIIGEIDRIVLIDPTLQVYEFFLDKRFFGVVNPGDRIRFRDIFQATILPATQKASIAQPGKNFRIGQVFELKSGSGTGALLKVTAVTPNGGIKYAELIKFGIGYTADFAVGLLATNPITSGSSDASQNLSTLVQNPDPLDPGAFIYSSSLRDQTLGFDEQGYINAGDYVTHEYVDGTYAGSLLREFTLNFRNAQNDAADPAIVEVDLGAVVKYPGYFESNNGFLNDSIFIQDSKYYQAFSYVLRIDERLSSYSSAVKTMLHPAGMALFGEFNITNNYDLSIDLESLVKTLGSSIRDSQPVVDSGTAITFSKVLSSSIDTPTDNNIFKTIGKLLASSIDTPTDNNISMITDKVLLSPQEIVDNVSITTDKLLASSIDTPTDNVSILTDKLLASSIDTPTDNVSIITDKVLESFQEIVDDNINITFIKEVFLSTPYFDLQDNVSITTGKVLASSIDTYTPTDNVSITTDKVLASSQSTTETHILEITKYVETALDPQTETGYIGLNSYAGQDIFASEYSVGSKESTFTTP